MDKNGRLSKKFVVHALFLEKPMHACTENVDFIAEFRETLQDMRGMGFFTNMGDLLVLEYKAAGGIACTRVPKYQRQVGLFGSKWKYASRANEAIGMMIN
jgi:hypothetical protein